MGVVQVDIEAPMPPRGGYSKAWRKGERHAIRIINANQRRLLAFIQTNNRAARHWGLRPGKIEVIHK